MLAYLATRCSPGKFQCEGRLVALRLREGFPLFIMTLGAGAYSAFNPFLLGLVAPAAQVADYALGERIARTARNAVAPILTVMYPYASEGAASTRATLRRAMWSTLGVTIALTALLVIFAPMVIWILAGPAFQTSVSATRILALNIAVITAGHLAGVQYLVARGKEALVTVITVASAPIHVTAILLAGRHYGALGGACTYVLTECVVTAAFVAIILRLRKPT
jgi:O-antigen/teichoic acid export membrane protein